MLASRSIGTRREPRAELAPVVRVFYHRGPTIAQAARGCMNGCLVSGLLTKWPERRAARAARECRVGPGAPALQVTYLDATSQGALLAIYQMRYVEACVASSQAARVPERSHNQDAAAHCGRTWRSRLFASAAPGRRVAGTAAVAPDALNRCALPRVARSRRDRHVLVYRIDPKAIVVVEVFTKKTQATPKAVIDTCQKRLRAFDQGT